MTDTTVLRTQLSGQPLTGDDLLVPDAPGVPGPVLEAQELVRESMQSYSEARAALRAAEGEAGAAPRLDRARDAAALAAGKSAPRDRLTFAAAEAVKAAQQRADAEAELLATRQVALGAAISEAYPSWSAEQDRIVAAAEAEALDLLEQLGVAVDQLQAARSIREGLKQWPEIRVLGQARFFKESEALVRSRREQAEQALDFADSQGASDSTRQISRDVVSLLVALKSEISGRAPKAIVHVRR